jgi:hypothetical protein
MMVTAGLVALLLLAEADATSPGDAAAPPAEAVPAVAAPPAGPDQIAAAPPAEPPEPAPEPPPPRRRRYADQGSTEVGLGLGYSKLVGFVGAGAFRYFVVDRVAPGVEATYVSGGTNGTRYGLLLGALRLVPVRAGSFALLLTGRAGRVLLADHADGWGAGGAAAILLLLAPTAGIELGYEALRLYPATFCADLSSCVIHGPVIAFRFGF